MTNASSGLDIELITPACGAIVRGVDFRSVDESTFDLIRDAWYEHLVLFFPRQPVDALAHKTIAERFGPLDIHPHVQKVSDDIPEIGIIQTSDGGKADVWHTDVTYFEAPPAACLAQYVDGPSLGGDTMWSNQYLAFERLSPALQQQLLGLTALHVSTVRDDMRHEQPAVRIHPVTRRKSLYVNRLFTRGFPQLHPRESAALLDQLLEAAERPELTCRWRWTPGDMVLWDNRCTQHYAINDYEDPRTLHRAMIVGDKPEGSRPHWDPPPPAEGSLRSTYERRTTGGLR